MNLEDLRIMKEELLKTPSFDKYISPIQVMVKSYIEEQNRQKEGEIYSVVLRCGVNVDKEELEKALRYDRNQYSNGFSDGYEAGYKAGYKGFIRKLTIMLEEEEEEYEKDN